MAETVLIVEDEQDVLDLVVYNVQKAGYKVLTARDGATGLERARTNLPALIVLDLMLPALEGTEVCKSLKADPKTAPHSGRHADRPCQYRAKARRLPARRR